jgi:hypothetical protein
MPDSVDELLTWFESAAIAHGYAHDTGRASVADDILHDLERIADRAKQLSPDAEMRLVNLMTLGRTPWVRYCSVMLFMKSNREQALQSLRLLSCEQGMFVPICIALIADLEASQSS